MSNIALEGNTSGTGTLTIAAPNTNTDRTLNLPDEAGTILTSGGAIDVDSSAPDDSVSIDSSGNIGIGTTSPAGKLHASNTSGSLRTYLTASTSSYADISFGDSGDNDIGRLIYHNNDNSMQFVTNASERMRIQNNGTVLIGKTTDSVNSAGFAFRAAGEATATRQNNDYFLRFYNVSGTQIGYIRNNGGTSTTYSTSSDHRLKENVVDLTGAITRLNNLDPKRFNFIADADTTVDGFLAHEVQTVVPEAVTGTHNEVDDDGNPVYQGIDQSKLVPLLTAALQEAIAKIDALETRVDALEAN